MSQTTHHFGGNMANTAVSVIEVRFQHGVDGLIRVTSDDVPGLNLCSNDFEALCEDLIPAIKDLFRLNRAHCSGEIASDGEFIHNGDCPIQRIETLEAEVARLTGVLPPAQSSIDDIAHKGSFMSIEHSPAKTGIESVRVRVLPDGRMSRRDAASYLGLKEKTLAMWALDGKGPQSVKVGGRRFYFQQELDRFINGEDAAIKTNACAVTEAIHRALDPPVLQAVTLTREPTAQELEIMRHTLMGGGRKAYRNHYCADVGNLVLEAMVLIGWLAHGALINDGRHRIYHVTDAGRAALARADEIADEPKRQLRAEMAKELEVGDPPQHGWGPLPKYGSAQYEPR
tara:strand:- start:3071 stop:4096 length:1026 start_codon:yes stop_codon:yes gene_type:complete